MAQKTDRGKPRMSLLPGLRALAPIADAMHAGNESNGYTPHSWRDVDPRKFRDALGRHFAAWLDEPQGKDADTGCSHLAHVGACVLILLWHHDDVSPRRESWDGVPR